MDIPIPLRFFEKLNLFQDFRKLKSDDSREWDNEGPMLSWAADSKRHKDLHTPLNVQMALSKPEITGPIPSDIENPGQYILNRFGSLVMRGYAAWSDEATKNAIRFTRAGFLLGEIINEIKKPVKNATYWLNLVLCWVLFYSGVVLVFVEMLKVLKPILQSVVRALSQCLCR